LNYEENIFDTPGGEYRHTWKQFQKILVDVFGNQIEPPDVPRTYLMDALIEIRVFETDKGYNETMQRWRTKLESWLNEMAKIRMARKLNKGIITN
jgi:hypothetical protein